MSRCFVLISWVTLILVYCDRVDCAGYDLHLTPDATSAIQSTTLNVNTILSNAFGQTQNCNSCDVLANLTDRITGALDVTNHLPNEHVIHLYCLKAYVTH